MKQFYTLIAATALSVSTLSGGVTPTDELTNQYGFKTESHGLLKKVSDGKIHPMEEETVYSILSCKEGSVFGNEYSEETVWSGSACADAGRPELGMEYYQHFDDCYYTFNEVTFLGFFNYFDAESYNWFYCNERGSMNENGEMTKPVTFTVGVFEEDENGYPGKCVMQKDIDIIGKRTNVIIGSEYESTTYIYEFTAALGQTIDLEHGFIQFFAKDMGDSPSCWFAMFTIGGNSTALQKDIINEEYSGQSAAAFCLYGDGSLNANKALQIERFLTPSSTASGKYEKVQVEISNIGSKAINDAKLELYVDGNLIATENIEATIESFESYKHTFNTRVDLSDGTHKITVKNATPGDEQKAYQTLSKNITPLQADEYEECIVRIPNVINITNVSLGSINNTSEGSTYSDYTSQHTTFRLGESQTLNITIKTVDYQPSLGVFIDWNGDYAFSRDEAVTFDSFNSDDNGGEAVATISMPENATIGEHRMRVVALPYYYTPDPTGSFYYGEVEDYTIIVEASPTDPVASVDKKVIELTTNGTPVKNEITITNDGNGSLNAEIAFKYVLPNAPTSNYSAKVAPKENLSIRPKAARIKAGVQKSPESDPATQYVLKYDNDMSDCIGIGNASSAIFANLYPGAMLSSLNGMKISSVDVYIGDKPLTTSIVIYGQNKQTECGEIITEQKFNATKHSWNHVILDQPVEIGTTDLWIGVKMNNMIATGYYIGVDQGPAIVGFGDIVNIGGTTWWSMADLGLNYNYCIRANVTGNPTAAISWLSTDKQNVEIDSKSESKINVNFNPQGLDEGLYEAYLEISSNDPLNSFFRIPVYMINGQLSGIGSIENGDTAIRLNGNTLSINGQKNIGHIIVSDMSGRTAMTVKANSNEASISLDSLANGLYIATVIYEDGKSMSIKVPVLK